VEKLMSVLTNGNRPMQGRRVVVTGMGAVSPNGIGLGAFWDGTRSGESGVREIRHFDVTDCPTRIAGQVDRFRPEDVLSGRDVKHVPRNTALALAAAGEALEEAGLNGRPLPLEERRSFGVVIGSGGAALEFAERQFRKYYLEDTKGVSLYTIPSSTPGSLSSEVSTRFQLRGPSHVVSTGCTSSTDAIGHALSLIRYGRVDRVLAGGADAPIAPGILLGFCLMKVMTPSWNAEPERGSRPFSRDRDGFVLGEGAWMLALESYEHARRRGAPIYGEILGYGSTCEAYHRVRLEESGEEPARAMGLALEDAGVDVADVDYLHLHGTSTVLNDRIETKAIRLLFGKRADDLPCSSLKSMIGHPQGASGAAGLVATLLAMRDRYLPPTINYDEPDPECDLDVVPNEGRPATLRTALCNCLGFGSKNSALVVRTVED
jgi:3-oxoacyl-[acyl-carrier-protein] synthase II